MPIHFPLNRLQLSKLSPPISSLDRFHLSLRRRVALRNARKPCHGSVERHYVSENLTVAVGCTEIVRSRATTDGQLLGKIDGIVTSVSNRMTQLDGLVTN